MAFKMRLNGNRISDSLFRKMTEARNLRTHGQVEAVEAVASDSCDYKFTVVETVNVDGRKDPKKVHRLRTVSGVREVKDLGDGKFSVSTSEGDVEIDNVVKAEKVPPSITFNVTLSDGKKCKLGETRLFNLIHADVVSEPERRAKWRAEHPAPVKPVDRAVGKSAPTPRSERFAREDEGKEGSSNARLS